MVREHLEKKYILSFGGGVNTVALMIYLIKKRMPFDQAVFADTGDELPETYEYLKIADKYLKRHNIPLITVKSRSGTLYATCKRRRVIPSQIWRWSTRDKKIIPIHIYYRSLKAHIYEYLGITYDEIERVKPSRESYITSLFPFVDAKITREDCVRIIKDAALPIPVKSGCYFCPFNTVTRWKEIYEKHRELYLKAMKLEEQSKHFPNQRLHPLTLRVLKNEYFKPCYGLESSLDDQPCGAYCMT